MFKIIKKAIHKFLMDMAKENQEVYGKGGLDCCKINRNINNSIDIKK